MLGQELCHCFIPSRLLCCWTHLHVWKLSLREVKSQSIKAEPVFHSGLDGLRAEILPLGPGLRSPCFYQCPLQSLLSSEWPDHPQVEDAFSRLRILSGFQLTLDDESPHHGAGRGQGVGAGPSSSHFLPPAFCCVSPDSPQSRCCGPLYFPSLSLQSSSLGLAPHLPAPLFSPCFQEASLTTPFKTESHPCSCTPSFLQALFVYNPCHHLTIYLLKFVCLFVCLLYISPHEDISSLRTGNFFFLSFMFVSLKPRNGAWYEGDAQYLLTEQMIR